MIDEQTLKGTLFLFTHSIKTACRSSGCQFLFVGERESQSGCLLDVGLLLRPYYAIKLLYKLLLIRPAAAATAIAVASSRHSNTCMHELFTIIKHFMFWYEKHYTQACRWSTVFNRGRLNLCSSFAGLRDEDLLRLCDANCWTSQLRETL